MLSLFIGFNSIDKLYLTVLIVIYVDVLPDKGRNYIVSNHSAEYLLKYFGGILDFNRFSSSAPL